MNASLLTRKLLLWLPPLVVAGLIYLLSTDIGSSSATRTHVFRVLSFFWPSVTHLPPSSQRLIETVVRKAAHVMVYTLFSTTLFGSFYSSGFNFRKSLASTLLIVVVFALGDEFHQGFVSSRTSSLRDVGFDLAGGLLGAVAVSYGALLERLRQGTLRLSRKS
jgi:VanZ family protein